jgi:hypothetical protein
VSEYMKTIKAKVASIGAQLGQKAKDATEGAAQVLGGSEGMLGNAKAELKSRTQKIDDAVDEAVSGTKKSDPSKMANGGKVRPQRG